MSIESEIIELEEKLAKLRRQKIAGFAVFEVMDSCEYYLNDDHEAIYDVEGDLAGIVINQKAMTKYFDSKPYKD